MVCRAVHPNPLIQSLQLAGVDWVWPGETLSAFWKTTAETMTLAGWAGYSNPWEWRDIRCAYLQRLGADNLAAAGVLPGDGFRLEACIALWLNDGLELRQHLNAPQALVDVYLARVDSRHLDEEVALLWAALLSFEVSCLHSSLARQIAQWRAASPNNMRWVHAHQVVYPFGMDLWPTARHMHRIVQGANSCESHSLDGLLS